MTHAITSRMVMQLMEGEQREGRRVYSPKTNSLSDTCSKINPFLTLFQIPPDFYQSKYRQESKPITDNEYYQDDKDHDK